MFETKIHEDNSHYNHFSLNPMLIFCVNCILNKLQLIAIEKNIFSLPNDEPLRTFIYNMFHTTNSGP